jgi:hypothetical protein
MSQCSAHEQANYVASMCPCPVTSQYPTRADRGRWQRKLGFGRKSLRYDRLLGYALAHGTQMDTPSSSL